MNAKLRYMMFIMALVAMLSVPSLHAQETESVEPEKEKLDAKSFIFGHTSDAYEFHISKIGDKPISICLPVIVKSKERGWFAFSSRHLEEGESYKGFYIAKKGSKYADKVVELDNAGNEVRPFDLSITKNVFAILLSCAIMLALFLPAAKRYKRDPLGTPGKEQGLVEWLTCMLIDDVIKPSVGPKYRKFAPYLLTAFFFIFINNLMGLIPIFPFGANVTGNIAVTLVLALFTYFITNVFGTKHYWKDIFWPDVPVALKAPIPLMPLIEFISTLTKPFALMIRLFANIFAGHVIMLVLMLLIFIFAGIYGMGIGVGVSVFSILLSVFMMALELLVAFIQAYVFTMLSAVFIGMAQAEPEEEK